MLEIFFKGEASRNRGLKSTCQRMNLNAASVAWGHVEAGSPGLCLFLVAAIPSSVSPLGWNLWNPQELISVACGSWLSCFVFLGNEDQLDMMYTSLEGKLKSSGSSFMKGIGSKCFVFKFVCYWGFIGKKKQWREYAIKIVLWGLKRWLSGWEHFIWNQQDLSSNPEHGYMCLCA